MKRHVLLSGLLALACAGCRAAPPPSAGAITPADLTSLRWDDVVARARGTTVYYAMWAGDEARNRFYQGPVVREMAQAYGITLKIVPLADAADLVNKLLNEKSAGRGSGGSVDLVWINGENFRTAKQGAILWGPFADRLPNIRYFETEARQRDFGTLTENLETPYQLAHFVFAYDAARVTNPPGSLAELRAWIESHPGRFTYPAIPDFTGSAFIRHVLRLSSGDPRAFEGPFDEALYGRASRAAIDFLVAIKPHLWRRGETYPANPGELDRLFVNGEVDFSMNYGPTFASERIARGEYPATTRTFVLKPGTISNYSYLAIPFNASNPAGALVVANALMSPEHALARARALGGLFPLMLSELSPADRAAVEALPRGPATLPLDVLAAHRLPEVDAEYLQRLERDWQREVLRR